MQISRTRRLTKRIARPTPFRKSQMAPHVTREEYRYLNYTPTVLRPYRVRHTGYDAANDIADTLDRARERGLIQPDLYLFENRKRIQRRASKARGEGSAARLRRMAEFHSTPETSQPRPRARSKREVEFLGRKANRAARAEIAERAA